MFKEIINNNEFYFVKTEEIKKAEDNLGITLPQQLKDFYEEVGYGFLDSKIERFNRFMSPNSISDFRLRNGMYDAYELEIYLKNEKDQIIFFEMSEGNFLSIGFSKNNYGQIFYFDMKIADSLSEFLEKYQNDEMYFD